MSRNQLGRHVVPMIRARTSSWLRMRWASAGGIAVRTVKAFRKCPKHHPREAVLRGHLVPVVGVRLHGGLVGRPAHHLHQLLVRAACRPPSRPAIGASRTGSGGASSFITTAHEPRFGRIRGGEGLCLRLSAEHADPAHGVFARLPLTRHGDEQGGADGGFLDDCHHRARLRVRRSSLPTGPRHSRRPAHRTRPGRGRRARHTQRRGFCAAWGPYCCGGDLFFKCRSARALAPRWKKPYTAHGE